VVGLGPRGGRSWGGENAGVGARREPAVAAVAAVATRLRRRQGTMGSWEVSCAVARPWEAEGALLDGGGADGMVGRRCRCEEGKTRDIYRVHKMYFSTVLA
jgi:hypothetical protein